MSNVKPKTLEQVTLSQNHVQNIRLLPPIPLHKQKRKDR